MKPLHDSAERGRSELDKKYRARRASSADEQEEHKGEEGNGAIAQLSAVASLVKENIRLIDAEIQTC